MAAPATAAISSRSVLCALFSTSLRGGVGEREIGAVAGASVCDWALLTRSRLFRDADIMSGRSGRARARDARPKGRDPQPQPTATRSEASMAESAWLLARQGSPVAKRCAIITTITNTTALPKNAAVLQLETVLAVKMAVGWRVRPSRGERQRARGPAWPARPRKPRPRAAREARAWVREDARQRDAPGDATGERQRTRPRACWPRRGERSEHAALRGQQRSVQSQADARPARRLDDAPLQANAKQGASPGEVQALGIGGMCASTTTRSMRPRANASTAGRQRA